MTSVKVVVRVRPRTGRENTSSTVIEMEGNKTRIFNPRVSVTGEMGDRARDELRVREFTFDHSFWSASPADSHFVTQKQVFEALGGEVVEAVYEGYNICVFAYGQTGSGKTYTMMGAQGHLGFIPRLSEALFAGMTDPDCTYRTRISFVEIYNEKVRDLLKAGDRSNHGLRIREHPTQGPYVQGLSQHTVGSFDGILQLIKQGNLNRVTASTLMNDTSSRSHAIFTITFTQAKLRNGVPSERRSKINLVDLAGSERADVCGSTGVRLKEGCNINRSLVTLGNVISALAEKLERPGSRRSSSFIPYRDSKLTYLLKDSLGGNAKTIMIATISPSMMNHGESLSTLKYANRARNIMNKPTVNEDPNVQLIRELREEIARLKAQLAANADIAITPSVHEELHAKEARMKVLTDQWTDKWRRAASILKEEANLELRKEGRGVVLDSSLPHLVSLEDDVLSTGVMLYHLKEGLTKIGTEQSEEAQDIVVCGEEVQSKHSVIEFREGVVTLHPIEGAVCVVNGVPTTEPRRLNQGAMIQFGKSNLFRFNYPAEAEKLKEIRKSLSTLSQSKSPDALNTSHSSLMSHSLTELDLSNHSLSLSPSPCKEETQEAGADNCLAEREREQRLLQEKLSTTEQELSVLQDCMNLVSQTLLSHRVVESALRRLEGRRQQLMAETQLTKEELTQAVQELQEDLSACDASQRLADCHLQQLIRERQDEVASLQKHSARQCLALRGELQNEQGKAEAGKQELLSLHRRMAEERKELLQGEGGEGEVGPAQKEYQRLSRKLRTLLLDHRTEDEAKSRRWHDLLQHHLQGFLPLDPSESSPRPLFIEGDNSGTTRALIRQGNCDKDEDGIVDEEGDGDDDDDDDKAVDGAPSPLSGLVVALSETERRLGPWQSLPEPVRQVKGELEDWADHKRRELCAVLRERNEVLQSISPRTTALTHRACTTQQDVRLQQDRCQQLASAIQGIETQVHHRVQELHEEQWQLQELQEQKAEASRRMVEEKDEKEQEIERKMKELEETSEAELEKIRLERERLLGLQQRMRKDSGVTDDDVTASDDDDDDNDVDVSCISAHSAAAQVRLEKQQELEKKTQECRQLQEKLSAVEKELDTLRGQQSGGQCLQTSSVQLEQQLCVQALVDQEVNRRLCEERGKQEKVWQRERALDAALHEGEVNRLKSSHQQVLTHLRDTMGSSKGSAVAMWSFYRHAQTFDSCFNLRHRLAKQLSIVGHPTTVEICIPHFALHGTGLSVHYQYEVKMTIGAETWSVFRRYSKFRELQQALKKEYPIVKTLVFPGHRLFYFREKVAFERRVLLETFLRELVKVCGSDRRCPLHPHNHFQLSRHTLALLHPFFRKGLFEGARHMTF